MTVVREERRHLGSDSGDRRRLSTTSEPGEGSPGPLRFTVSEGVVRTMAVAFAGIWALLALGNVVSVLLLHVLDLESAEGVATLLSLGTEEGPGTWVAGLLHVLCALLAGVAALIARSTRSRWERSWWLLAATFVLLSLDEVAAMHDRFTSELSDLAGGTSGLFFYAWVVPALALGAVFLLVQIPFLRHLGRTGRNLVLAGAIFVTGAAGLEMVEGVLATSGDEETVGNELLVMTEELLELGGVMLAACVLTGHLVRTLGEPEVTVRRRSVEGQGADIQL